MYYPNKAQRNTHNWRAWAVSLVVWLLAHAACMASPDDVTIAIDANAKDWTNQISTVKNGAMVNVEVKNINRVLYDVQVTAEYIATSSTASSIFTSNILPSSAKAPANVVPSASKSDKELAVKLVDFYTKANGLLTLASMDQWTTTLMEAYPTIGDANVKHNIRQQVKDRIDQGFKDLGIEGKFKADTPNVIKQAAAESIKSVKDAYNTANKSYTDAKNLYDANSGTVQNYVDESVAIDSAKQAAGEDTAKKSALLAIQDQLFGQLNVKNALIQLSTAYIDITNNQLKDSTGTAINQDNWKVNEKAVNTPLAAWKLLSQVTAVMNTAEKQMTDAKALYDKIFPATATADAGTTSAIEKKLNNASAFVDWVLFDNPLDDAFDVTKQLQAKQDEMDITVQKTPKVAYKDMIGVSAYTWTAAVQVIGVWKVNYSEGFFISRLTNQNADIVNRTTPTGTDRIVVQRKSDEVELLTGALAHVYYSGGFPFTIRDVQGALTLGAAVHGDDPVRYLTGISAIMGRKQRAILTVGVVWGKVSQLDPDLSNSAVIPDARTAILNSVTRKALFVGLTFNL